MMKIFKFQSFPRFLTFIFLATTIVMGCTQEVEMLSNQVEVPLNVHNSTMDATDLGDVIQQAATIIQRTLPEATYTGIFVFGDCNKFPRIDGKITLTFMQMEHFFFSGVRSHLATVSIDTKKQKMDIRILADPYLNYTPLQYDVSEMSFVLERISALTAQNHPENCIIEVTERNNVWSAKCTLEDVNTLEEQACDVKIEPISYTSSKSN